MPIYEPTGLAFEVIEAPLNRDLKTTGPAAAYLCEYDRGFTPEECAWLWPHLKAFAERGQSPTPTHLLEHFDPIPCFPPTFLARLGQPPAPSCLSCACDVDANKDFCFTCEDDLSTSEKVALLRGKEETP